MLNVFKQIKALVLIRLRLLINNLKTKAGIGKILAMAFASLLMILGTASASSDLIDAILKLPYGNLIAHWAIGFLVYFAIFVVFTGDLVSGHSLNTGQMSSDYEYLSTLPLSPGILIIVKSFERIITDYFGILFLLPAFIGATSYKAYSLNAFFVAFMLYAEAGLLIGLVINLILISLTRFFKPSTIKNFFSIFGYISAIITLVPFLLLSDFNPSYVPKILEVFATLEDSLPWLMAPIHWVSSSILYSTAFCGEFAKLSILWLIAVLLLTLLFYFAVKHNWFAHVHSTKVAKGACKTRKIVSGLFYKEFLLLKSDLNLLVNAVLLPFSIIVVEIYFLKKVFSFTSMTSIMNFIFGSIIYFSMFGPINIIGYEGKAISLLESMPISPAKLLNKKFQFWNMLALLIFIPSTIITFKCLNFDNWVTSQAVVYTSIFTSLAVWLSVSCSAIFAKYDTTVLQQRSTFAGKAVAMAILTLLLPIKSLSWPNLFSLLLFIAFAYVCYVKAQCHLAFRQDKESLNSNDYETFNGIFLFLACVAIETSIYHFFKSVAPAADTGIWAWALAVVTMIAFAFVYRKNKAKIFPKTNIKELGKALIVFGLTMVATYVYKVIWPKGYLEIISDFQQIAAFGNHLFLPTSLWKLILWAFGTLFMVVMTKRCQEYFINDESIWVKLLGALLLCLVSIPRLLPVVLVFALLLFAFNKKDSKESIGFFASIAYFGTLFAYLF